MTEKEDEKKISRRTLLLLGVLASMGGVWSYKNWERIRSAVRAPFVKHFDKRPNIIVVLLDTLRADHLGCYGYGRGISPNIDAFARESVQYWNTMAQSNWTLPSISSLFTSLFPHQHSAGLPVKNEIMRTPLNRKFTTLAEVLSNVGYHTMAVTGGAYVSFNAGMDKGFNEFHEINAKHDYKKGFFGNDLPLQLNKATELILDRYRSDRFFLFLHSYECHNPLIPPKGIVDYLDPNYEGPPITGNIFSDMAAVGKKNPDSSGLTRIKTFYDAEIFFSDRLMGIFFKALKKIGIYDDALIIFVSDHGVEYFEHKGWRHGLLNLYEELVRVPVIIKHPRGLEKGINYDRLARLIDIMPTILIDYLGFNDSDIEMEGTPLSRPLPDPRSISEAMMSDTGMRLFAMRDGDRKFIVDNKKNKVELFNLVNDQAELSNISDDFKNELDEVSLYSKNAEALFLENLVGSRSKGDFKIDKKSLDFLRDLGYVE
ncbi:MAG: sulfatase [Deltaproteobacteria bacterium]|uniref:Sulfatase n=1 Tax=Candidatus Zymogenus saltonus TaxID=2844893 RepID=A0A9D8PRV2_9DELT|nr:sulfatase [Candidatus Zymogenus saltonus]